MPFNQLGKTDRLSQKCVSLNPQARPFFGLRHESRQKDNRYAMKCRIGLNAGGDLAAIRFRHCDIEQDKVRLKILRQLKKSILPPGFFPIGRLPLRRCYSFARARRKRL